MQIASGVPRYRGSVLLSIDPGINTGWAAFVDTTLIACGLGDPRLWDRFRASGLTRLVIERPVIYPGGRTKNPNDVLSVAVNAGEWAGRFSEHVAAEYVKPAEWKGQLPKEIQHARQWAALWPEEQATVDRDLRRKDGKVYPVSLRHNVLDAIGIGLWAVGRGKS